MVRIRVIFLFVCALTGSFLLACTGSSTPTAGDEARTDVSIIADISQAEIDAAAGLPDLTEEQRVAIRAAFQHAREQLAAVRASLAAGEITQEEALALARQIHAELFETLQEILPPRPVPPFLGLTEEQVAQIRALRQELLTFIRETQAQVVSGELTPEEARAAIRAKIQETTRGICAVYTLEQQGQAPVCGAPAAG